MSAAPTVLTHVPPGLLGRVREAQPDVAIVPVPEEGEPPEDARGEVLLTMAWGSPNLARIMERGVRWVHAYGTGVDAFPFAALGGAPLSCSRGASAVPIAEWVLAVMLAAEKQLPESWIHEPQRWNIAFLGGLQGRTLGLVGLGGIGRAVAERALAFGMRVLAVRRTPGPSPLAGVEMRGSLVELAAECDHLVLAAPATPATRHLVDRDVLRAAKPGLHLVNVARGALVDQDALREVLDTEGVALASLDVVEPEPLPAGHWMYTHPRVRLSPHISWSAPGALDVLIQPFIDNLRRWRAGEPLENLVDLERGY